MSRRAISPDADTKTAPWTACCELARATVDNRAAALAPEERCAEDLELPAPYCAQILPLTRRNRQGWRADSPASARAESVAASRAITSLSLNGHVLVDVCARTS